MVLKRLGAKFRSKFLSISNLKRGLQLPGITCSALTFVHRRQVGVTRSARRLAFAMSNVFEWNWAKTFLAFTWFWKASPLPKQNYHVCKCPVIFLVLKSESDIWKSHPCQDTIIGVGPPIAGAYWTQPHRTHPKIDLWQVVLKNQSAEYTEKKRRSDWMTAKRFLASW